MCVCERQRERCVCVKERGREVSVGVCKTERGKCGVCV